MANQQIQAPSRDNIHGINRSLIDNLVSITDPTGEFLLHLPSGEIIDTKSWDTNTWEWTHGVGLMGLWRYHVLTSNESSSSMSLSQIETWFSKRFASGVVVHKNINTMSVMYTLAKLYGQSSTKKEEYRPILKEWAEWTMHELSRTKFGGFQHDTYTGPNNQQLWDDTLVMAVLPLTEIGILLSKPSYIIEAKKQFLIHIQYLFDAPTGAFFHGWTFDGNHNFANARWGRGNCWVTIAIPEFTQLLDKADLWSDGENDPLRTHLIDTWTSQIEFLLRVQDPSTGMWRTLLDHSDPGSYVEASATAGFVAGMLAGLRLGLIANQPDLADRVEEAARRGVAAVIDNVDEQGELLNTSFGTPMGDSLDFYREIPCTSMPYGQSLAIMALTEYLAMGR